MTLGQGRMTRFQSGRSVPEHAPGQNKNETDISRATLTGHVDELATASRIGYKEPIDVGLKID